MSAGRLQLFDKRASLRDRTSRLLVRLADGRELRLREFGTKQAAWVKLLRAAEVEADDGARHARPRGLAGPAAACASCSAAHGARPLHAVLRDQRVIAGIGRSWVDEILWTAELSPFKRGDDLDESEAETLREAMRRAPRRRARPLRGGRPPADPRQAAAAAAGPPPPGRAVPALRHDARGGALRGLRDVLLPGRADRRPRAQGPAAVAAAEVAWAALRPEREAAEASLP